MICHTGHILSIYPNFPRGHGPLIRQHSRDRFQRMGFPGSVRTQQSYTLPPVKMQIAAMMYLTHPVITRLELPDFQDRPTIGSVCHYCSSQILTVAPVCTGATAETLLGRGGPGV